jgi:hypothetical protein
MPSALLNALPPSMVCKSSTTTATRAVSQTTNFAQHVRRSSKSLPSAGSMPTSRMALLSKPYVTSQRGQGSNSSMLASAGLRL